jgi:hypothetical protein
MQRLRIVNPNPALPLRSAIPLMECGRAIISVLSLISRSLAKQILFWGWQAQSLAI